MHDFKICPPFTRLMSSQNFQMIVSIFRISHHRSSPARLPINLTSIHKQHVTYDLQRVYNLMYMFHILYTPTHEPVYFKYPCFFNQPLTSSLSLSIHAALAVIASIL
jgi:hypothetical protein